MTPAEKANELFDKFYKELDGYGILPPHHMQSMAKNLSIICVEQIIPCTWKMSTYKKQGYIDVDEITTTEYWEEVLAILKAQ